MKNREDIHTYTGNFLYFNKNKGDMTNTTIPKTINQNISSKGLSSKEWSGESSLSTLEMSTFESLANFVFSGT